MDTNSDSEAVAVESGTDTLPPLSVGKILREARISQGLNVADVASSIKFAPRQVEALEADDYSHLPELAFVRGFVRSYARLLHIDETPLLDSLPRAHQQLTSFQDELAGVPFSTLQSTRRINLTWLFAALALAVFFGIAVWLSQDKTEAQKATESPAVVSSVSIELPVVSEVAAASAVEIASPVLAGPAVVTPATVSPVVAVLPRAASAVPAAAAQPRETPVKQWAKQGPIHLVFDIEAWVDITDSTGKTLLKQVNPPGTERWLRGEPPFSLVIGNSSGVRLYYQGEEVDLKDFGNGGVARLTLVE